VSAAGRLEDRRLMALDVDLYKLKMLQPKGREEVVSRLHAYLGSVGVCLLDESTSPEILVTDFELALLGTIRQCNRDNNVSAFRN
jgi:hypothetical protein